MMNSVCIIGRLGQDIQLRQAGDSVTASFSIACNRDYKDRDGNYPTDWIDCVAWNQPASYLEQYANKGDMLAVRGRMQKDTWKDEDENTRSRTYVQVESVNILTSGRKKEEQEEAQEAPKQNTRFNKSGRPKR